MFFSSLYTTFVGRMKICIKEKDIQEAAAQGCGAFVDLLVQRTTDAIGGELTAETMPLLNAEQITLLAYQTVRQEVMEGGFIQLIHNGYGPFIFLNPFAKAMRLWGAREFSKLIYEGRKLYEMHASELTKDCSDEEFMALYEQFEVFDELDDSFIEMEEDVTEIVAHYVDENLNNFVEVEK